jgi:hypothetical protein
MNPIRPRLDSLSYADVLIARRFDFRVAPAGYERLDTFGLDVAVLTWLDSPEGRRALLDLVGLRGLHWRERGLDVREAMDGQARFLRALDRGDIASTAYAGGASSCR